MSHHATNWAIQQRGLRPATKIVLWHLADRHNPDLGCFPTQDRLAADCEMSRASLNMQLDELEARGLIRRVRSIDPKTRRQKATRYILGFEADFPQEPCPNSGHGNQPEPCLEIGHGTGEPCPNSAKSRVQNLDTNPVREPLNTTTTGLADLDSASGDLPPLGLPAHVDPVRLCIDACGPGLSPTSQRAVAFTSDVIDDWLEAGFDLVLDVLPVLRERTATATDRVIRTWDYFTPAVKDAHYRRLRSEAARESAEKRAKAAGAVPPAPPPPPDPDAALRRLADWINSDRYVPPSAVSTTQRAALLAKGWVTPERLRDRQIY